MTRYVVYRIGSNGANQPMQQRRAVALVEAKSAAEACKTRGVLPGTLHATDELVLAPGVEAYNNQHFVARPASRAPKADVRDLEEQR